jgi:hypothetical protein
MKEPFCLRTSLRLSIIMKKAFNRETLMLGFVWEI